MNEIIHFPRIARAFYFEPLALEEATMLACHMYLWPRISGQVQDAAPFVNAKEPGASDIKVPWAPHMRRQVAAPTYGMSGITDPNYYWSIDGKNDVAVIPINGMLMKGAGGFQEACMGVVNPDRVSHALSQAMANKEIKKIALDIGSPGGKTTGMQELAAQIKAAADTRGKTVWAFTDTSAASAAMWLASQANETVLTPSASMGSIGTYLAFLNPKVAMQMQGYSLELFKQGTHKGVGLPGRDLTQADREYLQSQVDAANAQFVGAVKAGRPKATEEALRDAKMYDGQMAVKQGLADGLVSGWDEFVSLL